MLIFVVRNPARLLTVLVHHESRSNTSFVWDKNKKENSYGTLSYYHLVEKFRNDYEYMYISEFYEKFSYKQNLSGFEFWNGLEWEKEKKYL